MTQIGEGIAAGIYKLFNEEYLYAAIREVIFDSGTLIWDLQPGGAEVQLPASGTPHWKDSVAFPAVYVRQGGTGETNDVKVKIEWNQVKRDGAAKVKGVSSDGEVIIEGDFNISGERGSAEASCKFTKKPAVVANYGVGLGFSWTVTAGGETASATGASTLKLYFVDAKPKPINWSYKKHYLQLIEWATQWAKGKAGEADVLAAIWAQFSDGTKARVRHATGFSYWKTNGPAQNLKNLLDKNWDAKTKGWSCRAIAHTFMECLALHGIKCTEVIPETAGGTLMFLVKNWDVNVTPLPNWESKPDLYYAGSWIPIDTPPLSYPQPTALTRQKKAGPTLELLSIDMRKFAGVPAQGQNKAPLGFSNHWIVKVGSNLYDSSYGLKHPDDLGPYATTSLGGWLISTELDSYRGGLFWLTLKTSDAWQTHGVSKHALVRHDAATN